MSEEEDNYVDARQSKQSTETESDIELDEVDNQVKHGIFHDDDEYSTQIHLSLIEIEDEILAASTPIGSPTVNQNKMKELITFHESLIGKPLDKIGNDTKNAKT